MDLPACDAEANWVAFQISCANVSSLDSQARALYIVALMENSWSRDGGFRFFWFLRFIWKMGEKAGAHIFHLLSIVTVIAY